MKSHRLEDGGFNLKYGNKGANIVAGLITTSVQIATLFMQPTGYYIFFSIFEIVATASAFILAVRWSKE